MFPFNGYFARNGDIVQTPFIGAYRLHIHATRTINFTELNPITVMRALWTIEDTADDTSITPGDTPEQIVLLPC